MPVVLAPVVAVPVVLGRRPGGRVSEFQPLPLLGRVLTASPATASGRGRRGRVRRAPRRSRTPAVLPPVRRPSGAIRPGGP
nr:hypothetical protein C5F59_26835 [Streptomyces sp. QL37]